MRPKHLVTFLALPVVLLAALLTLAGPAAPAHASGIVSVCDEAHLRAALAGGGTVTFSCSGTITLTAEIVIAADTTLDGSGQTVTISGNHAVRVFSVNAGVTLNLNALTIADGSALYGGGIYINESGILTVNNNTFSSNRASGSYPNGGGGGICSSGTLTVSNSTFAGNRADLGGGILSVYDTVTVNNSTFYGNHANGGGGIFSWGTLTVSSSTFDSNSAKYGGGISGRGTLTVSNSTFDSNSADNGGGIDGSGMSATAPSLAMPPPITAGASGVGVP